MSKRRVLQGIAVEEGGGSVYADLGYPDSDTMCIKAQLVTKIAEILRKRGLARRKQRRFWDSPSPRCRRCYRAGFGESRSGGCWTVSPASAETFRFWSSRRHAAAKRAA